MDRKKSFVGGAAILGICGIICKVIGAFFRIPLANILGTQGIADYQIAYPLYSALLVISSSGLPTAISKLVSAKVATGDYRNAHYTFQVAFRVLLLIGIGTTAIMALGSRLIATIQGSPESYLSIIAIAPSLFFVSVLSSYRGYFQGLMMMTPTALSQVIEQVGKLGLGLWLANLWVKVSPQMGAAGALVGISISELIALLFLIVLYNTRKSEIKYFIRTSPRVRKFDRRGRVVRSLMAVAIPVTLGACIMPLVSLIDNPMVINILKSIGYSQDMAKEKFALLTGYVAPIINMPAVISTALQMSLVPAISGAMAAKRKKHARNTATMGVKLAILIGMPCAIGLFIMGGPVMTLLYKSTFAGEVERLTTAVQIMQIMSIALFFLTLIQTITGILQGVGMTMIPVRNLAIGAVVKIIASFILLRIPAINVLGAPISTLLCYLTATILNLYYVIRYVGVGFSFLDYIVRPGIAVAGMGVTAYFSYMALIDRLGNTMTSAVAILLAVIVYLVLVLITKGLKPEDAALLPGGRRLDGFMRSLGLWR